MQVGENEWSGEAAKGVEPQSTNVHALVSPKTSERSPEALGNKAESSNRKALTVSTDAVEQDRDSHTTGVSARAIEHAPQVPSFGKAEKESLEPLSPSWGFQGVLASLSSVASAVVRSVRELMDIAKDTNLDGSRKNAHLPILMLGVRYDVRPLEPNTERESTQVAAQEAEYQFKLHIYSCLWFTYRSGMPPIGHAGLTTDAGWGCMHRSGQMLFAQALLHHRLGRDWRLQPKTSYGELPEAYREVLELFADSPSAPLSVHNITRAGEEAGKRAGQWFSPGTICKALRILHERESYGERWGVGVLVYDSSDGDNTIYKGPARRVLQERGAVLLLLPLRLGMHTIDPSYLPKVGPVLGLPHSLGFVGGHPHSAHYFVASQGSQIYYLDPHSTRPVASLAHSSSSQPLHSSWHCRHAAAMALQDVDGSVAFGFYCRGEEELEQLCAGLESLGRAAGGYPAISVAEEKAAVREWDEAEDEEGSDDMCVL